MLLWNLLITLVLGAVAGLIAGRILRGQGYGIIGNVVIGLIGSVTGSIVFGLLGLGASGLCGRMVVSVAGVIIFILGARIFYDADFAK